ncbi:prephenate dehydratase [Litchfieldia alkalitelluris]|uniref:prephenate dehydratase n=1 Tax=Litchfieldia alkalitelluris TaxID=304268 RepID=UPI000998C4A3|nr:prephenate dehydratase [Litchfieldia alkalitelluris]
MKDLKLIGYLGPKATFSEQAVKTFFPNSTRKSYDTIPSCIDAAEEDQVDAAVVPLENTIEGSVNLTLDYLIHEQPLQIVGEVTVPIQQHLMVHPNHADDWTSLEKVYSHPHAIAQCHKFLHQTCPEAKIEYVTSTAAAAEYVSQNSERPVAAIANELAAKEYGLIIVKRDIHDFDNNHTRFVVLHKADHQLIVDGLENKGYKTTLMITLPSDQAGALHQVLSAFAWRKLNLSKIESRPMKTGLGNYFFIIDIEQQMDEVLIPSAIAELEALGCSVKVLGSYPYF